MFFLLPIMTSEESSGLSPQVALAVIYGPGHFLMQLRDEIPGILYPGHWGFFGGHMDPGETPRAALVRELAEEISYCPPEFEFFGHYHSLGVWRHVFAVPLTVDLSALVLGEGWDLGLMNLEEVRQGRRYSDKAGKVCPLGAIHQQILLDFAAHPHFGPRISQYKQT